MLTYTRIGTWKYENLKISDIVFGAIRDWEKMAVHVAKPLSKLSPELTGKEDDLANELLALDKEMRNLVA